MISLLTPVTKALCLWLFADVGILVAHEGGLRLQIGLCFGAGAQGLDGDVLCLALGGGRLARFDPGVEEGPAQDGKDGGSTTAGVGLDGW